MELARFSDRRRQSRMRSGLEQANGTSDIWLYVEMSGVVTDLYDFQYHNQTETGLSNTLISMCAEVQAGYGTLGSAGHVFLEQINFQNALIHAGTLSAL
jgi:hypothetical protein